PTFRCGSALRASRFASNPGSDERIGPFLDDFCLYEARSAVDCALDFVTRKNEPNIGGLFVVVGLRVVRLVLGSRGLAQQAGLVERFLALAFAFGLKLVELFAIFLKRAIDALLMEGEALEVFGVIEVGLGPSERGVHFGMIDVYIGGFREVAEGQYVVFDGADALQAPEVFRDEGRELEFESVLGPEAIDEFLNELVMRGALFDGRDADLASDAMAQSVH